MVLDAETPSKIDITDEMYDDNRESNLRGAPYHPWVLNPQSAAIHGTSGRSDLKDASKRSFALLNG